ncbi:hypothetical protein G7Z17_g11265 [Cylindrodendrum hubeiense]|uniref:Heterokaryon incompatibility domain-containing protein n=1 Tax=Cylindrodendrum hubeiense TaxID=595255 RepID=A0A9P5GW64_9HYPO|nr:hypothetical protein G7Z17_g11265 [Cylindrodendrum hubeiense]
MFCEDCLNVGKHPALLTDDLDYTLKPSLTEFRKSAADGCTLCEILLRHLDDVVARDPKRQLVEGSIKVKAWPYPECSGELMLQVSPNNKALSQEDFSFVVTISPTDPASEDSRTIYRCIEPHSGSQACMKRIAKLLETCERDHPQCISLVQDAHLPTRVLDLGSLPPDQVRVFESKGKVKAPYVTLSHCWGKFDPSKLILNQGNLAELTTQLAYGRLAPVFRDAVDLTRNLGIRYLWIDALCIIQDSKSDWAVESLLMGSVYAHATLNIAASSSPDSNTPFLRPRKFIPDVQLPFISIQTGKQGTISLPLNEFHYGNRSMYPYNKPSQIVASSSPATIQEAWSTLAEHWYKSLNEFGLRHLTYADDALPAMSAIAEHFGTLTKDSYLAGIWKSDLHRGLLWHVTELTKKEAVRSSVAPSWSWASLFRESGTFLSSVVISASRYRVTSAIDAQLLDAELDPMHGNTMGQMRRAALRMRGLTKMIVLDSKPDQGFNTLVYKPTSQQFELSVSLDDDFFFASCSQTFQGPVELLALFLSQWNHDHHYRDVVLSGLLLAPATNATSHGAFTRCGTFEIRPGPRDEGELAELRQKPLAMVNAFPGVVYGVYSLTPMFHEDLVLLNKFPNPIAPRSDQRSEMHIWRFKLPAVPLIFVARCACLDPNGPVTIADEWAWSAQSSCGRGCLQSPDSTGLDLYVSKLSSGISTAISLYTSYCDHFNADRAVTETAQSQETVVVMA